MSTLGLCLVIAGASIVIHSAIQRVANAIEALTLTIAMRKAPAETKES